MAGLLINLNLYKLIKLPPTLSVELIDTDFVLLWFPLSFEFLLFFIPLLLDVLPDDFIRNSYR